MTNVRHKDDVTCVALPDRLSEFRHHFRDCDVIYLNLN